MIKIGIDIDNVLSESYPSYLSRFNAEFGFTIQMAEIREFYFLDKFSKEDTTGKKKQMIEFIDTLMRDMEFQINLPPIKDSVTIIKKWAKLGYQIHFISARPVAIREMTKNWLNKNGYFIPGAKLDLYDNKKHVNDVDFKREIAEKEKIDIFIEDAFEIAMGMDIPVFLFDYPWNQGKLKKNITRVYSWREIEEKLLLVMKSYI